MMEFTLLQALLIAASVGIASGSIGAFVVLERLALAGDALSHVALPGIALAFAYSIDPFFGALVFLVGAALVVWYLRTKTNLPTDALIGILFTASLAVGILTIPDQEIIESLFGEFPELPLPSLIVIVALALGFAFLVFRFAKQFAFRNISRELAQANRIGERYELLLLVLFAVIVALGIKLVGTLLMGALTIIPALAARNIARSMRGYIVASTILGGLIATVGIFTANTYHFLPGPTIVLLGIIVFLGSLLVRKN